MSITNKGLKEVTEKQLRNDPSKLIHTVTNKGLVKYQKKTMKVTNQGLVSTEETNSNLSEVDFENKGQNKQHGGKRPRVSNLFL